MKLLAVLALALAFTGTVASIAGAHNTPWKWNTASANHTLLDEGLAWKDDEFDEVYQARCYGWGQWAQSNSKPNQRLWKHFRCYVATFDDESYWISLHVTGKFTWTFYWLRQA